MVEVDEWRYESILVDLGPLQHASSGTYGPPTHSENEQESKDFYVDEYSIDSIVKLTLDHTRN